MVRYNERAYILLLSAALTLGTAVPALASDGDTSTISSSASSASMKLNLGVTPTLGQISLSGDSFAEVKNVYLLPEKASKTVIFTISVHNESSTDLQFIDYWVKLKTKDGNQISVRVLPQDKDKNRITPKSVQDIKFYATVNETTELKDLVFEIFRWDFSRPQFEQSMGEVQVPEDYSMVTPVDQPQMVEMSGSQVKTTVKKVLMTKNDKNVTPTVILTLENTGDRTAALPGYQFLLRTSEGYMYPLEAKNVKDLSLTPQTDKDIELSGTVPASVSREGWQLIIVQYASDLKLNLPVAYYELPPVSERDSVDSNKEYPFKSKNGTYTAKLNTFQRLPWEDQDLLSASLTLFNRSEDTLPLPELTGYFELDDSIKVDAKLVQTDKVIGLPKGTSANYQWIGRIPYTYTFSKVKLVLQEKTGDKTQDDLLNFVYRSELLNVPYYNVGESVKVTGVGRSTSYKVRTINTYTGDTADVFTVQLEATNLEKRFSDVSKLVAQFKTADGVVYPAAVTEIKNKVSPGGSALLLLSSPVPKGFPTSNMHVLIGEAVTEDKFTDKDVKPDAYVNAAALWLPNESFGVQDHFNHVDLFPYSLTIGGINTWLDNHELRLTFDYELNKNVLVESNTEGRKLVFGFEDEKGNTEFTKEFDFKDFDVTPPNVSTNADASTTDDKLRLGKHVKFRITHKDDDLIYHLETLKTYKLSIYDSFQGQKKLLATKKIEWFTTTD